MHRRSRILGFGPVGCVLLIPLAALIWTVWTGYDLRYDLMRLVNSLFGWTALHALVVYFMHAHFQAFYAPHFCLTTLCGILLILHFSPRRLGVLRYAAVVLWSVASPSLCWFVASVWLPPPWFPAWTPSPWASGWMVAQHILFGLVTVLCLWYLTRSRAVALATLAAVAVLYPLSTTPLALSVPPAGYAPNIAWHLSLFAILTLWVLRDWRSIHPDYACQSCGYDLRDLASPACPECGVPTSALTPAS